MAGPKKSSVDEQDYDPFAALERAKQTLAGNQQFLDTINKPNPNQKTQEEVKLEAGARKLPVAMDALNGAMIPASFLSGPVGVAANAGLMSSTLRNAYDDPSTLNKVFAGLSMLPVLGPVMRGVRGGGKVAAAAEELGPAKKMLSREVPYRMGSGTATEGIEQVPGGTRSGHVVGHDLDYVPSPRQYVPGAPSGHGQEAETLMQKAREQVNRFFGEHTPQAGPTKMSGRPIAPPDASEITAQFTPPSMRGLEAVMEDAPLQPSHVTQLVRRFGGTKLQTTGEHTAYPPKLGGREGDLHGAQTTGGMFGFEELPEIDESELSRLQQLFSRLGR